MPKSVLIAESNEILIDAIEVTLTALGFTVVGKTSKLSEIEDLVIETKPDLLIFDLDLSEKGKAAFSSLKTIKKQVPEMKILALGFHEMTDEYLKKFKDFGFDEYFSKFNNSSEFANLINILFP
jgi:DNA-binding NarL/FixJ family response regulator